MIPFISRQLFISPVLYRGTEVVSEVSLSVNVLSWPQLVLKLLHFEPFNIESHRFISGVYASPSK